MFTNLVAVLLRDGRWNILQRLLREPVPVKYIQRNDGPGSAHWNRLSGYAPMLMGYGETKGRLSYIADLVNERHTKGALASLVDFRDFVEADYFLYLRTCAANSPGHGEIWRPWCYPYLEHVPMFIRSAERNAFAKELAATLAAGSIDNLKTLIVKAAPMLQQMFIRGFIRSPMGQPEIDRIGSIE
jgi:hypothetical protein